MRARPTHAAAWALALGLVALGLVACADDATEPRAEPPAPGSDPGLAPAAPAPAPTPAEPPRVDAFALPGLRALAPADRLGWPTESVHLTSSFGFRIDPVTGLGTRLHRGIDLRGSPGDLVLSIGAGTVSFAGHDPLLGNLVIVDHGGGLESLYGHLSDVLVAQRAVVDRGAAIGLVGNTGRSAAPHLHLTVRLDGIAIDPLEVLGEPPHRPKALATPLEALEPPPVDPVPAPLEPAGAPAPTEP